MQLSYRLSPITEKDFSEAFNNVIMADKMYNWYHDNIDKNCLLYSHFFKLWSNNSNITIFTQIRNTIIRKLLTYKL